MEGIATQQRTKIVFNINLMYGIDKAQGSWDHNHFGFFKIFVFVIEFDDSETKLLSLWLWHIIRLSYFWKILVPHPKPQLWVWHQNFSLFLDSTSEVIYFPWNDPIYPHENMSLVSTEFWFTPPRGKGKGMKFLYSMPIAFSSFFWERVLTYSVRFWW